MILQNQSLFQPAHFFALQQLRQKVQFAAPNVTIKTGLESSKGKGNEKQNLQTGPCNFFMRGLLVFK